MIRPLGVLGRAASAATLVTSRVARQ